MFVNRRKEFVNLVVNARYVEEHLNTENFSIKAKCLELYKELEDMLASE
jgi:hypothetical protein